MLKKTLVTLLGLIVSTQIGLGAPPVVKTVPWVAANPLVPHDTWSGRTITLKGTCNQQGSNLQWIWDFGDGAPVATGTVNNSYVISAAHSYSGLPGTVFTARLTVRNTATGENASKEYYVKIQSKELPVEVNIAIDEGLWYLHSTMYRFSSGGLEKGDWGVTAGGGYASLGYYGCSAGNLTAFEVNGHLETGSADNPYTETVQRAMRRMFEFLAYTRIAKRSPNGDPEDGQAAPNGIGLYVNQSSCWYQGGMVMDAIVASGTPDALASTGPVNVNGRTYKQIVQDMVDGHAYGACPGLNTSYGVAWRYDYPASTDRDNSPSQWAAIGIIAAEREFGCTVPMWLKAGNVQWLKYSAGSGGNLGTFGYTAPNYFVWGPYAVTPSGMVQCAMDGVGRGSNLWDNAETYLRDRFGNSGGPTVSIKSYYYGLFSFTKAMLLHNPPIEMLHSKTSGVSDLDWYGAEKAKGAPTDGVARQLVNDQNAGGFWYGHDYYEYQYPLETSWAIIMLNRTVFSSGVPVAVAKANPNPAVAGQVIQLDGTASFHQDPTKHIVQWQWDIGNDGSIDATGPFATVSFPALGDYPVRLIVADDATPPATAQTIVTIIVSTPPLAPTAKAGGPYNFCPNLKLFLDGSGSTNPDDGESEPGKPKDHIINYEWDLSGSGTFNDAFGVQPDVTAFFAGKTPGDYIIQLRVTDNTALSFPSSGLKNLSSIDSTVVHVRGANDDACQCISDLVARPKSGMVQLVWTSIADTDHYNVYRSQVAGGPYNLLDTTTSTFSTYLDKAVSNGTTYYYIVRPANLLDEEQCQSNEASVTPAKPRRR